MFDVILQTNNSEDNRMDKDLTTLTTVQGALREATSLLEPTLAIDGALPDLVACNYMTIPAFGRSYFVREPVSLVNGLYQITGHVDVLSTYKAGLQECSGIVQKNETNFNTYLNDGTFHAYANPLIQIKKFSGAFPADRDFVLIVAGGTPVPYEDRTEPETGGDAGTETGGTQIGDGGTNV